MNTYVQTMMETPEQDRNFGVWYPPEGMPQWEMTGQEFVQEVMAADEKKDTCLWPFLFQACPEWKHGLQGTGDCVSWEWAHKLDVLTSVMIFNEDRPFEWKAQIASEAVYGFGRVEIFGRNDYGGPGMNGGYAAKGVEKFGTLHRMDYGNGHDLTHYSGSRAVQYGRTGVPDILEPIAAQHKPGKSVQITDSVMGGALVQSGYPLGYCGHSYWGLSRDNDGIASRRTRGWHGMCITGVRYKNDEPYAFWVANTGHGSHCTGPVGPHEMPAVYAECGSWMPVKYCEPIFQAGDCYAHSFYEGFPAQKLPDWGSFAYL